MKFDVVVAFVTKKVGDSSQNSESTGSTDSLSRSHHKSAMTLVHGNAAVKTCKARSNGIVCG